MKISQITFALGETINCGNFNSVRIDLSVTADVAADETGEEAYAKLRDAVTSKVAHEVAKHKRVR